MFGCAWVYMCVITASVSVVAVLSHYRRSGASVLSVRSGTSPASQPL